MKGVPLRVNVGLRDIKENQVELIRRDTKERFYVTEKELVNQTLSTLQKIQSNMFDRAKSHLQENTRSAATLEELTLRYLTQLVDLWHVVGVERENVKILSRKRQQQTYEYFHLILKIIFHRASDVENKRLLKCILLEHIKKEIQVLRRIEY